MNRMAAVVLGLAAAAMATPSEAGFKFIPAKLFFVKNNSAVALTCSIGDGASWEPWFALASGAEWNRMIQVRDQKVLIRCKPPAAAVAYPIEGGNRYSFLREAPGGPVKLKLIATTTS